MPIVLQRSFMEGPEGGDLARLGSRLEPGSRQRRRFGRRRWRLRRTAHTSNADLNERKSLADRPTAR